MLKVASKRDTSRVQCKTISSFTESSPRGSSYGGVEDRTVSYVISDEVKNSISMCMRRAGSSSYHGFCVVLS